MGKWIVLAMVVAAAAALLLFGTRTVTTTTTVPVPPVPLAGPGSGPAPAPAPAPVVEESEPAVPTATTPSTAPATVGGIVVVGRVVDDRCFPVGGARISLHRTGQPPLLAVAGTDGRFRVPGVPRPTGNWILAGLIARTPDGRIAVGQAAIGAKSPTEVDVGSLVVGASLPVAVRVVDGGTPVPGARVVVGWGYAWPFEATAGADGVARFDALPKVTLSLLATAEGPARAGRSVVALQGNPPQPLELAVTAARTIVVTVLEKGAERPIPGATFRLTLQVRSPGASMQMDPGPIPPIAPTDAEGKTRIEGTCAADFLYIEDAIAPGYFPSGFRQGVTVRPDAVEARVELVGGRALRFPVVAGEAPVPADGSVLTLSPMPGSGGPDPAGGARMEGTDLVVDTATAGFYAAEVTAPDGARARLWADDKGTPPREVSFRPARIVAVLAKRPDGTPVPGAAFLLRNQGNNPLGDAKLTGVDGRIVFDGLYGELTEVCLLDDPAQIYSGMPVGSVDLAKGGGTVEVVIPAKRSFVARVTVDGRPGLVSPMYVSTGGGRIVVMRFDEDPAKGEIRFELPIEEDAKSVDLLLTAPPYLQTRVRIAPIPETGPIPLDFAIKSGAVLLVEVKAPKDTSYRLSLQRWDAERSMWVAAMIPGQMMMGLAPGPDGIARAEPLVEGRYRVAEFTSGVVTDGVEVRTGGEPARLSIDISKQGWAKGKVSLPEGAKLSEVRILVKAQGIDPRVPSGAIDDMTPRVAPDGTFMVRVPGDRPVSVIPWHPLLVPAPDGIAEVTEPRDDLVLRLVAGGRVVLRLDPPVKIVEHSLVRPRVLFYAGEPVGDPVSEHPVIQDGDGLAFGGFKPGTWTLWIDPSQGRAPVVVRRAVLGESGGDLGTIATTEGSHVRVKILVKEGTAAPRISLWASNEDAPKYARGMGSNGEETAVLAGLGPGRFRITASSMMGSPGKPSINEVHELDGTNDLELTLDLR